MKIVTIRTFILVAVLAIVLTAGFNASAFSEEGTNKQEVTLKVDGMTCRMCPLTIKTALKKLNGVVDADVSYKDKEAKALYEDGKVTVDDIVKTIESSGNYKATSLSKERK
ncbi:MAG TPA: cation transporter [Thermodesulfobacteriota bacterium]